MEANQESEPLWKKLNPLTVYLIQKCLDEKLINLDENDTSKLEKSSV